MSEEDENGYYGAHFEECKQMVFNITARFNEYGRGDIKTAEMGIMTHEPVIGNDYVLFKRLLLWLDMVGYELYYCTEPDQVIHKDPLGINLMEIGKVFRIFILSRAFAKKDERFKRNVMMLRLLANPYDPKTKRDNKARVVFA